MCKRAWHRSGSSNSPRGLRVGSGPAHVRVSILGFPRSLASPGTAVSASYSPREKRDNNSYLEEPLRALEIKDVKHLLRSAYPISVSGCLRLSLISCHSDSNSAQLCPGKLVVGGGDQRRQDLAWAAAPHPPSWPGQPLSGPGALEGLPRRGDAVARHRLLGNTLFLLAWPPPRGPGLLWSSSCLLKPLSPDLRATAEGR